MAAGNPPVTAGTFSGRGYSGGAQTRWLESTLAAARADASIDWIVVQLHQCACSSAPAGNGSDLGVRREWLPLFDTYEVDLVLSGHDHGYERSFPVRGFDTAAGTDTLTGATTDTRRPRPVTTVDSGVFDTSQGTVHLVLGSGGGARGPGGSGRSGGSGRAGGPGGAEPGPRPRLAKIVSRPAPPVPDQRPPGEEPRAAADAVEAATWSARRDASTGYGIAVFDVSPGSEAGGQTSVTVRYYHAAGPEPADTDPADTDPTDTSPLGPAARTRATPTGDYTLFETFTLVRPRSDGRRWHLKGLRPASAKRRTLGGRRFPALAVGTVSSCDRRGRCGGGCRGGRADDRDNARRGRAGNADRHGGAASRHDVSDGRRDLGAGALRPA
jgi:hypothetical protein